MPQFITSKYIESDYVKVYPSGFRDIAYKQSKLMTEDNITLLQNFTVSADGIYDDPRNTNNYLFRLLGYTFQVLKEKFDPSPEELSELDTTKEYPITLKIKLIKVDSSLSNSDYDNYGYRLANIEDEQDLLDVEDEFQGLQMSVYEGSNVDPITLIKPGDIVNGNTVNYYEYEYLIGKLVYEDNEWSFIPEYQTTNNFTADRIIEEGILGTPGGTSQTNSRKIIDIFELESNTVKRATGDSDGNNIKASYGAYLYHPSNNANKIGLKNKNNLPLGDTLTINNVENVTSSLKGISLSDIFEAGEQSGSIISTVKKSTESNRANSSNVNLILYANFYQENDNEIIFNVTCPDYDYNNSIKKAMLLKFNYNNDINKDCYVIINGDSERDHKNRINFNSLWISSTNTLPKGFFYRVKQTGGVPYWEVTFSDLVPYSGGTQISLNGENKRCKQVSIFAPTQSGSEGQILLGDSDGNPVWSTSKIGDTNKAIYIDSNGVLQEGNTIPNITLNGLPNTSPNFYAPTLEASQNAESKQILIFHDLSHSPKWSTDNIGATNRAIYLQNGKITQGNIIPTITLNGSQTTSPSFYSPTSVGSSGQILKSNGSGAPSWTNQSNLTSGQSDKVKVLVSNTVSSITEGYKNIKFITSNSEATDANTIYFIVAG